ncbi:chemotaxis protein CheW [Roseateles asaccharophilus]|uniref:Chemotaxis protein CheW n=1 Tax=Roseateles asaccharophilus TaxID=582607 RepID=A0ABU2AAY8_9BURK|nr:chemotaxis protein CheW [Roseateles asaccharophilus]MDR7334367.1 purine-binding chemotaxis protein CheW [Roseateles asaccharophilus]
MSTPLDHRRQLQLQPVGVESPAASATARPGEYLSFQVGDEEYALSILQVQEIRRFEPPTRIAGAPPSVKGVVNLRGVIVPIVDLRLLLAREEPRYDALTVVIVLNVRGRVVGVVVDAVSDVLALSEAEIRPAPSLQSGAVHFINGIATVASLEACQRVLILTDTEKLLDDPSIGVLKGPNALH